MKLFISCDIVVELVVCSYIWCLLVVWWMWWNMVMLINCLNRNVISELVMVYMFWLNIVVNVVW